MAAGRRAHCLSRRGEYLSALGECKAQRVLTEHEPAHRAATQRSLSNIARLLNRSLPQATGPVVTNGQPVGIRMVIRLFGRSAVRADPEIPGRSLKLSKLGESQKVVVKILTLVVSVTMNHTDLDHCFTVGGQHFIITFMPSIVQQLREGPLVDTPYHNGVYW
jgi:hypothetical protein